MSTTATRGRKALDGLELERRDLEHGEVERFADQLERRGPEIARGARAQAGRAQQGVDQQRRRRFPVGAGDGDDRDVERAVGQLDVAPGAPRALRPALARDAGARDHEVESGDVRERRAELELDLGRQRLESADRRRGAFVRGQHARAALRTEARRAAARDAEAEHEHALSGEREHQRSFSDERATSPRIAETIQKRTTIFCSGQPSFSKW